MMVREMEWQEGVDNHELKVFLGNHPHFHEIDDYLQPQLSKALDS